ncbi:hypothetical protein KQ51_01552 [Candidatus Izimaplasma bacterium HR1]|jgi:hypothetical protein|uniref:hypothetical protein n=1 Tax=Candidatus Izimoplasma sp. HR1 TaxID=1541959 RepID=UPI0004F83086|nr:hypothetical protein KQ51_01552 [Candidatus Izimaplasma bacterium HR1]
MSDFNVDRDYKKLYEEHLEYFYDGFALNKNSIVRRYPGKFSTVTWIKSMSIGTVVTLVLSFLLSFGGSNILSWFSNMLLNFSMGFFVSLVFLIITDKKAKLENYLDEGIRELEKHYEQIDASLHLIEVKLSFSIYDFEQAYLYMRFATNAYLMITEYLDELYKVITDTRIASIKNNIGKISEEMFANHSKIYNPGFIDAYYNKHELNFKKDLHDHVKNVRSLNLDITMQMYNFREIIRDISLPIMDNKYSKIKETDEDD